MDSATCVILSINLITSCQGGKNYFHFAEEETQISLNPKPEFFTAMPQKINQCVYVGLLYSCSSQLFTGGIIRKHIFHLVTGTHTEIRD